MSRQPPKSKRISKFSIRQLFPNLRSSSDETRISEYGHERVSVRYPRGRAPTLHLRLSEFDVTPFVRALRSPARSPNSLHTHLIPEIAPAGSTVGAVGGGYMDAPSDVPISPTTPDSARTPTRRTPEVGSSNTHVEGPQSSVQTQDGHSHRPAHTREDTMSSTMSNLQMEAMTLSGSPPDPGFVLPIPSRSRSRQDFGLPPANFTQTVVRDEYPCATNPSDVDLVCPSLQELEHVEDTQVGYRPPQLSQAIPLRLISPMNESIVVTPLDPPRSRRPSWISEGSDASSAVISTATKLTRANTGVSMTSVTTRRAPAVVSDDGVPTREQSVVAGEHLLTSPLSAVHIKRPGGDTS